MDKCELGQLWQKPFEMVENSNIGNSLNWSKLCFVRNWEQIEVKECLLSLGVEHFVFQFDIKKFKN
jgi:hypothetical protein